jgi:hypothetical protein
VVIAAAGELMGAWKVLRAVFCFESIEIKAKELALLQHVVLICVEGAAEEAEMAVEDVAVVRFVLEWMVIFFEEVMNFLAVLLKTDLTGRSHLQRREG